MEFEDMMREAWPPVPEPVAEWAQGLMNSVPSDYDNDAGVFGYGVSGDRLDAVVVIVGSNTDISDKEIFPDEVDGTPIIYDPGSAPELH